MIDKFLNKDNKIGIVGVSKDLNKWGRKIYEVLKSENYKVYPINPNCDFCYKSIDDVEKQIHLDLVIFVVPPKITKEILNDVIKHKIKMVWFQPGSANDDVLNLCEKNNIEFIYNTCFVVNGLKKNF